MLAAQIDAGEGDTDGTVPGVFRSLGGTEEFVQVGGIGKQDVDATVGCHDLLDQFLHVLGIRYVAVFERCFTAFLLD